MAGRTYQAYGTRFELQSECALEPEDFRKMSTLAKVEKQAQEMRLTITRLQASAETGKLAIALERQEARAKRLRKELGNVLV